MAENQTVSDLWSYKKIKSKWLYISDIIKCVLFYIIQRCTFSALQDWPQPRCISFVFNCLSSHSIPLPPSYSLWPEKDDINPKVNVPGRGAEEWVGVWVTHLQGFDASIAVKLNSLFSRISLSGPSIILLFSPLLLQTYSSFEVLPCHALYLCFTGAGCQVLAANFLTRGYLASFSRAHAHSHQKSFKVTWCIAMAINSTAVGEALGAKHVVTKCEQC